MSPVLMLLLGLLILYLAISGKLAKIVAAVTS
jgi:hypothetical protein